MDGISLLHYRTILSCLLKSFILDWCIEKRLEDMHIPALLPQDDWVGVKDPKKRKQIQDRLAQRARRKRLAEAKVAAGKFKAIPTNEGTSTRIEQAQSIVVDRSPLELDTVSGQISSDRSFMNEEVSNRYSKAHPKAQPFLSAILETGKILGISCGTNFPSKSKPAPPGTPDSLQPTLLQLSTVHWQWIDRFPFPDFRDEIIINSGDIDEEEFIEDLFNTEPFTLAPGGSPWDPSVYTMNPLFQAKWGYLFPSFSMRSQISIDGI